MTTTQHMLITACAVALYAGAEAGCDQRTIRPAVAVVQKIKPRWTIVPLRIEVQQSGPLRTYGIITMAVTSSWSDTTTILARRDGK